MSKVLISEASRRLGVSDRSIRRQIASGRLQAEKKGGQWYVGLDGPQRAADVLKEKPDLGLQDTLRRVAAKEWEQTHPGVERSWSFDPFEGVGPTPPRKYRSRRPGRRDYNA